MSEPEGEVLTGRLFEWSPGRLGVEFAMKDGTRHARPVIVDEAILPALKRAQPWDGQEPH